MINNITYFLVLGTGPGVLRSVLRKKVKQLAIYSTLYQNINKTKAKLPDCVLGEELNEIIKKGK